MKISYEFEVARPADVVWELFQDVSSVAKCLPGAEITGQGQDGSHEGRLSVKLGPMTASFEGAASVTADAAARSAVIEGKGVDKAGGSRGQVKVVYLVSASDVGSTVSVDADVTLSGPAAQFGRTGLINEMSRRLIADFVECLESKLLASNAEEAASISAGDVRGLSLFFASLWSWLKGIFRRGA